MDMVSLKRYLCPLLSRDFIKFNDTVMRNVLIISFLSLFVNVYSQEKELLIDTVFIKSFSNEKIVKAIKESKKQYKKYDTDSGTCTADLSLTVNHEHISDFHSLNFRFEDLKKKKYKKNTKESFYKEVKIFEFNPEYPDLMLSRLYDFTTFSFVSDFDHYRYKMREIGGKLQITCYSKMTNLKAVIILDKNTLLPEAVYKSIIAPTYRAEQMYLNITKNSDSKITYDILKDEAMALYRIGDHKIDIAEIRAEALMDQYKIQRTDKKGALLFTKDLETSFQK